MKEVIAILAAVILSTTVNAQTKEVYTLSSFPTYDEFGNYYQVVKEYDHLPTTQDSISFKLESGQQVDHMIDSMAKEFRPTPPSKVKKRTIYKHDKTHRSVKRGSGQHTYTGGAKGNR